MRTSVHDGPPTLTLGTKCSEPNMRALWATFILNTSFTICQALGARAANSLALLGDTGTMAVDSLTYAINLAAEYNKYRLSVRTSDKIEIVASVFSVFALVGVTIYVMQDALKRLSSTEGAGWTFRKFTATIRREP